ncbi:MAG: hypothetical protein IH998_04440 [Proteobacteria bacterium]|nr:hypothetical protein [Pseudomonadota bacterium]
MSEVWKWINEAEKELSLAQPELPKDIGQRIRQGNPSVDVIVVLGKGFLYHDSSPVGLLPGSVRNEKPFIKWVWIDDPKGNLLFLFAHLTHVIAWHFGGGVNTIHYIRDFNPDVVKYGS